MESISSTKGCGGQNPSTQTLEVVWQQNGHLVGSGVAAELAACEVVLSGSRRMQMAYVGIKYFQNLPPEEDEDPMMAIFRKAES